MMDGWMNEWMIMVMDGRMNDVDGDMVSDITLVCSTPVQYTLCTQCS